MKVILTTDIPKKGKKGEIIEFNDGYARNYVIKKNLGVEATVENLAKLKAQQKKEAMEEAAKIAEANVIKEKLNNKELEIKVKVGKNNKMFGSVTSTEIAEALKEKFNLSVDKKNIIIKENLKSLGQHNVRIKLYQGIEVNIIIILLSE